MIGRLFRRRLVPVFLAAVVLLGAGAVFLLGGGREAAEASAAITDWGLSFQEGAPPVCKRDERLPEKLRGALCGRHGEKRRSTSRLTPALKTATRRRYWTRSKSTM